MISERGLVSCKDGQGENSYKELVPGDDKSVNNMARNLSQRPFFGVFPKNFLLIASQLKKK